MKKQKYLSNEELAAFCGQVAILLHAGIAPIEGIRILLSDTKEKNSRNLLQAIIDAVDEGNSFTESLNAVGVFPDYVINTVRLGEQAGSLDEVMSSLAGYYEREAQISESVRSAVAYPLVMIVMMLLVIIVLITKVLPIFNQVFVQLGSQMTGFAASLMNIGEAMNSYSVIFIIVLAVIVALAVFLSRSVKGRNIVRSIASRLHLFRKYYEGIASGRFASGMALALSAGLDTFESLRLVSGLVENRKVEEKIDKCREYIKKGESFAEALKKAEIFTNVNNRMISVGFKTGEADRVMNKIAEDFEEKTEKKVNEIISIIEPTLVIILSLVVGLVLLSVIMPLMGIMTSIG